MLVLSETSGHARAQQAHTLYNYLFTTNMVAPPPSPLRDKLAAKNAAPATRVAPTAAAAPVPRATAPSAAPASTAKAKSAYPSFDMRKI